ncbi:hypothetical protein ACFFX0_24350 [Citricoccus parietis]|uniref:Uncharacterized protein n=1 Tax=Citricoccus parietis TaxID=592307 RepID=A0ABV5G5D8_9MICC
MEDPERMSDRTVENSPASSPLAEVATRSRAPAALSPALTDSANSSATEGNSLRILARRRLIWPVNRLSLRKKATTAKVPTSTTPTTGFRAPLTASATHPVTPNAAPPAAAMSCWAR